MGVKRAITLKKPKLQKRAIGPKKPKVAKRAKGRKKPKIVKRAIPAKKPSKPKRFFQTFKQANMTFKDKFYELLPPDIAELATANCSYSDCECCLIEPGAILSGAFIWKLSPEGSTFWIIVHEVYFKGNYHFNLLNTLINSQ